MAEIDPRAFQLRLRVGGNLVSGNLDEDLAIPDDPEDLAKAVSKYPSQYYYYSYLAEVAKREDEQTKRRFDVWYSAKYMDAKRELRAEFGKSAINDTMIKSVLYERYPQEFEDWNSQLDSAAYRRSMLSIAAKAMLEKGNASINILSYKKQQYSTAGRA